MSAEYGPSAILTRGMWHVPYKATNVLCADGVRRTARITGDADTFFSIPATVTVQGLTVSGFISAAPHHSRETEGLRFHANSYGKNGHLLSMPFSSDVAWETCQRADRRLGDYLWRLCRDERVKTLPGSRIDYALMAELGITDTDRMLIRHTEVWGWCGI